MYYIDAKQESDIQIFDLSMALLYIRYKEPTLRNASIALKDGESIEFEMAFQLELLYGPITLIGSTKYDKKDEIILTLDPKKLDELP